MPAAERNIALPSGHVPLATLPTHAVLRLDRLTAAAYDLGKGRASLRLGGTSSLPGPLRAGGRSSVLGSREVSYGGIAAVLHVGHTVIAAQRDAVPRAWLSRMTDAEANQVHALVPQSCDAPSCPAHNSAWGV